MDSKELRLSSLGQGSQIAEGFDPRTAAPFINKSVSEETRRAYRRAVADFFQFAGGKHPTEVTPNDVLRWRGWYCQLNGKLSCDTATECGLGPSDVLEVVAMKAQIWLS
ncbi:MAG: hypothetical protein M3R15_10030 [Acidobacteriota bacterium]|nr:hypothetical protein [Acidobacteriota bacterium]